MTCQICNNAGDAVMLKCTQCGMVFCRICAQAGRGPYPKMKYGNVCPYCGSANCLKNA